MQRCEFGFGMGDAYEEEERMQQKTIIVTRRKYNIYVQTIPFDHEAVV